MALQPADGTMRTERPGFLLDLITGADTDLGSVQRLAEAGAQALAGSADCAALLIRPGGPPVIAGNSTAAEALATSEDRNGDGPLTHTVGTSEVVKVDRTTSTRWQAYRRRLSASGFGAALALPLELEDRTSCALLFLVRGTTGLTPDLVAEARWFAEVAAQSMKLALEVRSVRSAGDNLKTVLESRTSIDVACGVIMAQNSCTYAEAFSKLAGASRQRNLKVRSVAENVVKSLAAGAPAARLDPPAPA